MEAREAVEDTDDQEQLVALNRQFKQRQAQLVKQLSEAFRAHDLATAARLTAELTYWVRLEQATQQKL
jgi:DnaJ-domain-containing protein 1